MENHRKVYSLEEVEKMLLKASIDGTNNPVNRILPIETEDRPANSQQKKFKNLQEYFQLYDKILTKKIASLQATRKELMIRETIREELEQYIKLKFPGTLEQFGSCANGFGLKNMDMDLCLVTDLKEEKSEIVEQLGEYLKSSPKYQVLNILSKTRIPIVKLEHCDLKIFADIGINNILALRNTLLLKSYCSLDPRVSQLGIAIKYWAKRRNINDPYHGTLSSYALNIMMIYFLQNKGILPNLQEDADPFLVDGFDTGFRQNLKWKIQGSSCILSLLNEFFIFYARTFQYKDEIVSIRAKVDRVEKEWTIKNNGPNKKYWFCIEDPFELTHNLARGVTKGDLFDIRGEFLRGTKLIKEFKTLDELWKEFEFGEAFVSSEVQAKKPLKKKSPIKIVKAKK